VKKINGSSPIPIRITSKDFEVVDQKQGFHEFVRAIKSKQPPDETKRGGGRGEERRSRRGEEVEERRGG